MARYYTVKITDTRFKIRQIGTPIAVAETVTYAGAQQWIADRIAAERDDCPEGITAQTHRNDSNDNEDDGYQAIVIL